MAGKDTSQFVEEKMTPKKKTIDKGKSDGEYFLENAPPWHTYT